MLIISARELRSNMTKYVDLALAGQSVVLKLPSRKSLRLVPVEEDDTLMSKEEFYAKLEESKLQIERGEVYKQEEGESIADFVDRLLCTE